MYPHPLSFPFDPSSVLEALLWTIATCHLALLMKSADDAFASPLTPSPSILQQTDYAKDTHRLTEVVDQLRSLG